VAHTRSRAVTKRAAGVKLPVPEGAPLKAMRAMTSWQSRSRVAFIGSMRLYGAASALYGHDQFVSPPESFSSCANPRNPRVHQAGCDGLTVITSTTTGSLNPISYPTLPPYHRAR